MPVYTDQLQRSIKLEQTPQRIISLVPSQTELLFDLGLDEHVVGITKFCVHPAKWFRTKTRIGGTKNVNINTIHSLKPDLIIGNKEENVKEQVEELALQYPVWMSDVNNLEDALNMIRSIGEITGKKENALLIAADIDRAFQELSEHTLTDPINAAYLIWKDPYIAVGGNTFIDDMLSQCGFINVFKHISRYPEIDLEKIRDTNCGFIFLSSEPYPFKERHADVLREALPAFNIKLVNGEMFSWYGSRLVKASAYFKNLIEEILIGMKNVK